MAGPSHIAATEFESLAHLRDPACGIPFDVHFEIEDEEGSGVGTVGGHKAVLALKSPEFKAMLFGPLAETSDVVKIRGTSMFAFKEMLHYMHDAEMNWHPWSLDLKEIFRIADLAERYNLPGLKEELVGYARGCLYPRESLLEIAKLAERFHMFTEVSEALLHNCVLLLSTILETPDDFNNLAREWSEKEAEDMGTAFRLLARINHRELVYEISEDTWTQKIISHIRYIWHSIQPRYRLQQLRMMLNEDAAGTIEQIRKTCRHVIKNLCRSLWICQLKDNEKAAEEGVPLTLDTLVEGGFSHAVSIKLHLDMISIILTEEEEMLDNRCVDEIWETMLGEKSTTIPGAKSVTLLWFSDNPDVFNADEIAEKLTSSADNVKELPEYNDACDVFM